jgi:hypothetical protein
MGDTRGAMAAAEVSIDILGDVAEQVIGVDEVVAEVQVAVVLQRHHARPMVRRRTGKGPHVGFARR